MTNLPQKNVNSIQFGKEIVHVNHILILVSPILKEKSPEDCSFSVDPKHTVKVQSFRILRNFLGSFRKSLAIVGSSSETLALGRKKTVTPLAQKMWAGIVFPQFKSFHSVIHSFHGLMNSINWPASSVWVFIAQLGEHCSANAGATGLNPVEAPKIFFSGYFCNCLNRNSLRWSHTHFNNMMCCAV